MTKSEIQEFLNCFGLIKFNGSKYDKSIHGFVRGVARYKIIFERLEGDDLIISISSIHSFKKKREPELVE